MCQNEYLWSKGLKYMLKSVENILGKGENAGNLSIFYFSNNVS